MSEAAGVAYGLKNVVEGAVLLAKGLYDPTLPLKAKVSPITDINLPRTRHSLSIVKGKAYIFGGYLNLDGRDELAENDMNVVTLPSLEGVGSADFKRVGPSAEAEGGSAAPRKRAGHTAAVIDDRIFIFGGNDEGGEVLEEDGKVSVFDTNTNKWSTLTPPPNGKKPCGRSGHAAVASEHPRPVRSRTDAGSLPQQPPDPATVVPEPPDPDSYGTVIILGGTSKDGEMLSDLWTFDIFSRTWSELPQLPPPPAKGPSIAMVENRLYAFAAGETQFLDTTPGSFKDIGGQGELGLGPLGPWNTIPPHSSPDEPHPGERVGAAMVFVTTGQGRNYMLLCGGQRADGETLEDIWALQLKPEGMTAASFKDAARMSISADTHETQWSEVRRYYDQDDKMVQEGQSGRGIGDCSGFAAAKGTEVDGASVVLWGGKHSNGAIRGGGLMITVDR